jgi:hypothetical protein
VAAGTRVDVTARLAPKWPPRIVLVFERRVGRRWVVEQRKRVNVRGGKVATYVRPRRKGRYRVTLQAPGITRRRHITSVAARGGVAARRR